MQPRRDRGAPAPALARLVTATNPGTLGGMREIDGRYTCPRCRCDLDEDYFCRECGATSLPPRARPRVIESATIHSVAITSPGVEIGRVVEHRAA